MKMETARVYTEAEKEDRKYKKQLRNENISEEERKKRQEKKNAKRKNRRQNLTESERNIRHQKNVEKTIRKAEQRKKDEEMERRNGKREDPKEHQEVFSFDKILCLKCKSKDMFVRCRLSRCGSCCNCPKHKFTFNSDKKENKQKFHLEQNPNYIFCSACKKNPCKKTQTLCKLCKDNNVNK